MEGEVFEKMRKGYVVPIEGIFRVFALALRIRRLAETKGSITKNWVYWEVVMMHEIEGVVKVLETGKERKRYFELVG